MSPPPRKRQHWLLDRRFPGTHESVRASVWYFTFGAVWFLVVAVVCVLLYAWFRAPAFTVAALTLCALAVVYGVVAEVIRYLCHRERRRADDEHR